MKLNYIVCLPSYLNVYNLIVFRNIKQKTIKKGSIQLKYDTVEYYTTSKKFKSIIYDEYNNIPGIKFNTQHNKITVIFNKIFNSTPKNESKKNKGGDNKEKEIYKLLYIGDYIEQIVPESPFVITNDANSLINFYTIPVIMYHNVQITLPLNVEIKRTYKNTTSINKYQRLLDIIFNYEFKNVDGDITYCERLNNNTNNNVKSNTDKNIKDLLDGIKLSKSERKILFQN